MYPNPNPNSPQVMGDQDVLHVHCRGMDPHLNKVWVETKCAGAQLMVRARLPEAWGEARGLSLGMGRGKRAIIGDGFFRCEAYGRVGVGLWAGLPLYREGTALQVL